MRQIIRYRNRKLYDPWVHSYIPLKDLLYMVKFGDEFEVVEYATGKVITHKVLTSAIYQVVTEQDTDGLKYFIWNELELD